MRAGLFQGNFGGSLNLMTNTNYHYASNGKFSR